MKKKTKVHQLSIDLVNMMLEPYGVTYEQMLNWKSEEHDGYEWFQYYRITRQRECELIELAISSAQARFGWGRDKAREEIGYFILNFGLKRFDERLEDEFEEAGMTKDSRIVIEEGKRPKLDDRGYKWDGDNVSVRAVPDKPGKWDFIVDPKIANKYKVKSAGELSPDQVLVHLREYSIKKHKYHK